MNPQYSFFRGRGCRLRRMGPGRRRADSEKNHKGVTDMKYRWKQLILLLLCAALLMLMPGMHSAQAAGYGIWAGLKMKLATRTGPGTWYDQPGSFFSGNYRSTSVRVLTRAWDDSNEIWWLQVEFTYHDMLCRAYTGLKRVNVDINSVPEEQVIGSARTTRSAAGYWGPGTDYMASQYDIPSGTYVTVLDEENGYAQVEFYDSRPGDSKVNTRRAWIPTNYLSGSWYGQSGGSGNSGNSGSSGSSSGYGSLPMTGLYKARYDDYDTLTVQYVGNNYIIFDVFWYRIYGMDGVLAMTDSSDDYWFSYDDGYNQLSGYLYCNGSSVHLSIGSSNQMYIKSGTYIYDYAGQ